MKIFGWAADNMGCGWYRVRMPLNELARRGHETMANTIMPDEWLDTCDVLLGQRICEPGPSTAWQRIAVHPKRPLMVFDIDDDLWEVDPRSPVSYAWFSRPDVQERLRRNITVADLVTVTTETLADKVRALNPNVVVIPNFVPQAMLDLEAPERTDQRVVIGWAGSDTHVMDFEEIGPQFARFLERNSAAMLHTIGGSRQAFQERFSWAKRVDRDQWTVEDWFDDLWEYYRALGRFDIATAPLTPHVFNRSKSWIKALEAAARGVPIVASDVGPYPDFVVHGETGFLLRAPHEWPTVLRDLVLDAGMRAEMGAAARDLATRNTIEGNGHLWEQALLSQLTGSRAAS
ncbi:glycosyltransferase family 4 protein [Lentzea guizhouensis]|uniref:glycosyltransferase family 4 protein n=1 Tax=Lentzea guizhouensis TaxID=1586287 RepID=UPI0012B6A2CB|nr:glycosyltransferase family 4 protein [Lentzea guizhouensis]